MLLRFRVSLLLGLIVLCLASVTQADLNYAVQLKTAGFTPDKIADASARSAELVDQHVLIQFEGSIDEQLRQQLIDEGIELLDYVPNYAFTARFDKAIDQSTADRFGIRWFGRLEPVSKISPM